MIFKDREMELTRGKKLFYGFLLSFCFLAVMAVDDSPEQEELGQAQVEWTMEQAAQQLELERQNRPHPQAIDEPAFAGKVNWKNQYAYLRKKHEERKAMQ